MNDLNLENQLSAWQPRHPSPALKARLFPALAKPKTFARTIRWLAPTGACALIAFAALQQEGFNSNARLSADSVQGDAPAIAGVTINRSPDFFEWTNRSGSVLNVRSFLPGKTN